MNPLNHLNPLNPLNPLRVLAVTLLMACCALAQTIDPFPKPIADNGEPLRANLVEFASVLMLAVKPHG
jgi:hypothetical protein